MAMDIASLASSGVSVLFFCAATASIDESPQARPHKLVKSDMLPNAHHRLTGLSVRCNSQGNMNHKFFGSLMALGFATGSNAAWAAETPCYKNAAAFMAATWGPDHKNDENLKSRQRKYGSQTFTVVTDITPGTNIVWNLFLRDPKRGLCRVLKSNPVAGLEVTRTDKAGKALEMRGSSQAPGTEPSIEVTYTRDQRGSYQPTRCRELTYPTPNEELAVEVRCANVLVDLN